jgi:ABC-type polysaccharide/polyol phosphate export permease
MVLALRELVQRRNLLYTMAWREIRVKYKQSVMGMMWAVLMPIVIVCAGLVVRLAFSMLSGRPLALADVTAVAVKAAPWAFFVSALRFGTSSLINNVDLVTKIYMPRLVFPLSSVTSQLFDFGVATVVVSIFLGIAGVGASVHLLWLPLLLLALILLAAGVSILSSAASLFYRDVRFIIEVFLTFAIFFTPVFYEPSLFGKWGPLLLLNPVSPLLESISAVVVHHRNPAFGWLAYSVGFSVVLFCIAVVRFKQLEPFFAENV